MSHDQILLSEFKADLATLPSPPAVALDVLRLMRDDGVSVADLAGALARDPVLASRLLQLANSALFRRGGEITTLERATMLLGLKTVKILSLGFTLTDTMESWTTAPARAFPHDVFWHASLVTAVSARSLGVLVKHRQAEEGFVCGLLSRIGQLALAHAHPEAYGVVQEMCGKSLATPEIERSRLGVDHLEVGAEVLRSWRLPELFVGVVAGLSPQASGDRSAILTDIMPLMRMARLTADVICLRENGPALRDLRALGVSAYRLSTEQIDAFLLGLEHGIAETARLFRITLSTAKSHRRVLDDAKNQLESL